MPAVRSYPVEAELPGEFQGGDILRSDLLEGGESRSAEIAVVHRPVGPPASLRLQGYRHLKMHQRQQGGCGDKNKRLTKSAWKSHEFSSGCPCINRVIPLSGPDPVDSPHRSHHHQPIRDCRSRGDGFPHFIDGDLDVFLSGTNDVDLTVFVREVKAAVGSDRRSGKRAAGAYAATVKTFACNRVEGVSTPLLFREYRMPRYRSGVGM